MDKDNMIATHTTDDNDTNKEIQYELNKSGVDIKFFFRLGITLLLLIVLASKINWIELKAAVTRINIIPFLISYSVFLASTVVLAFRLQTLMRPTVFSFSIGQLMKIQFISRFYSMFLPAGIGLAAARWFQITQNRVGRRLFVVITLIERMMLLVLLLLCAGIPLFMIHDNATDALRSSAAPPLMLLLFICLLFFGYLLHPWIYERLTAFLQWVQNRISFSFIKKTLGIYEDFGLYIKNRRFIARSFGFHVVYQGLNFIRFFLVFAALQVQLPLLTIIWISALILLVLIIPVSLAGFGVRESGFAWIVTLYGIQPEVGVLIGVLLSCHVLMNAIIGATIRVMETLYQKKNNAKATDH